MKRVSVFCLILKLAAASGCLLMAPKDDRPVVYYAIQPGNSACARFKAELEQFEEHFRMVDASAETPVEAVTPALPLFRWQGIVGEESREGYQGFEALFQDIQKTHRSVKLGRIK